VLVLFIPLQKTRAQAAMELVQAESTAKAHAGPVAVTMLERLNARLDKAVREGSLHDIGWNKSIMDR